MRALRRTVDLEEQRCSRQLIALLRVERYPIFIHGSGANYQLGQAHPPALHLDPLDEVAYDERGFRELEAIYDYGDLRVLIGLNELTFDPVEPQGLVERQPPSAEAPSKKLR
jgi:hypothetical protein